jgi:hypothetical protein
MRKKLLFALAFVFFLAMAVYSPREASAVPAFARQTGFACSTCHYQHFPELNSFGREFKAGGFTMVGGQSLVEGEVLSLPSVLNGALMIKAQYNRTWGNNGEIGETGAAVTGKPTELDHGTWDFPTDNSLFLAGRAGEHVGFLTEIALGGGSAGGAAMDSIKIPFTFTAYDTKLDIIPFSTGAGPSWSFEVLNTGIVETHTALLHKPETFAANYIGASQDATGLAFVAYKPYGYINYALWSNEQGDFFGAHRHIASPLHYIRLAVTPQVAGWDLGLGGAGWFGTETRGPLDTPIRDKASAWAIDAQAQGTIMDFPIGVYTSYASASSTSDPNKVNIFNPGAKDKTAWTILGEVGVLPNKLAVSAGYRLGHNGDPGATGENTTDNATTLALIYSPALNVQFGLEHSWYSGSGSRSDESASSWGTCPVGAAGCPATVNAGPQPTSGPGQLTTVTMWIGF